MPPTHPGPPTHRNSQPAGNISAAKATEPYSVLDDTTKNSPHETPKLKAGQTRSGSVANQGKPCSKVLLKGGLASFSALPVSAEPSIFHTDTPHCLTALRTLATKNKKQTNTHQLDRDSPEVGEVSLVEAIICKRIFGLGPS